jgi:hypothetical protein
MTAQELSVREKQEVEREEQMRPLPAKNHPVQINGSLLRLRFLTVQNKDNPPQLAVSDTGAWLLPTEEVVVCDGICERYV